MEIIDAHAHIYPQKIAEKATNAIGTFYDIKMEMPAGTAETLIEDGKRAGISKFIVHSCATKAEQVRAINEFIKREIDEHKEFIGFMTLHQDLTEGQIQSELTWCYNNGFKGIKMHPDFQKFYIDGENADKIYRTLKDFGKEMPILFHTGDDRYPYSEPERLCAVAKKYPTLKFIGAHFGGYRCWDRAEIYKGIDNVYFDTCSSLPFLNKERAKELIGVLGAEKFFFGTDFPMWDAKEELERFDSLNLCGREKEQILALNVKRFLKID